MKHRIEITKNIFGQFLIGYECPGCGKDLTAPMARTEKMSECPKCGVPFTIPGKVERERILEQQKSDNLEWIARKTAQAQELIAEREHRQQQSAVQSSFGGQPTTTRHCPFCAEEIQVAAVKCKHCGEFLDGRSPEPTVVVQKGGDGCGLILTIACAIILAVLALAFL